MTPGSRSANMLLHISSLTVVSLLQQEIGAWNRQFRMQLPEEQANMMEQADPLKDFGDENVVEGDGDEDAVVVLEEEVERLGVLSRGESMSSMVD